MHLHFLRLHKTSLNILVKAAGIMLEHFSVQAEKFLPIHLPRPVTSRTQLSIRTFHHIGYNLKKQTGWKQLNINGRNVFVIIYKYFRSSHILINIYMDPYLVYLSFISGELICVVDSHSFIQ